MYVHWNESQRQFGKCSIKWVRIYLYKSSQSGSILFWAASAARHAQKCGDVFLFPFLFSNTTVKIQYLNASGSLNWRNHQHLLLNWQRRAAVLWHSAAQSTKLRAQNIIVLCHISTRIVLNLEAHGLFSFSFFLFFFSLWRIIGWVQLQFNLHQSILLKAKICQSKLILPTRLRWVDDGSTTWPTSEGLLH